MEESYIIEEDNEIVLMRKLLKQMYELKTYLDNLESRQRSDSQLNEYTTVEESYTTFEHNTYTTMLMLPNHE